MQFSINIIFFCKKNDKRFFQRSRRLFARFFFGLKFLKLQWNIWNRFFVFRFWSFETVGSCSWNFCLFEIETKNFQIVFSKISKTIHSISKILAVSETSTKYLGPFFCFSILVFWKWRTSPMKFMSFQFMHEKSGLTPIVRMIFSSYNCHLDHEQHKDITKTPTGWSYECLRVRNASKTNYYHPKTGSPVQNPNVENWEDPFNTPPLILLLILSRMQVVVFQNIILNLKDN